MTAPLYGREALRRLRERETQGTLRQAALLDDISPDAPMDDATLTVWNGARWVAWNKWLATAPVVFEQKS